MGRAQIVSSISSLPSYLSLALPFFGFLPLTAPPSSLLSLHFFGSFLSTTLQPSFFSFLSFSHSTLLSLFRSPHLLLFLSSLFFPGFPLFPFGFSSLSSLFPFGFSSLSPLFLFFFSFFFFFSLLLFFFVSHVFGFLQGEAPLQKKKNHFHVLSIMF